jgi:hypothetical protein
VQFLEKNGSSLKELRVIEPSDTRLSLAIAKFCPNLRKISCGFDELEMFKIIFSCCQYLESFITFQKINKELLEVIVKYSPKRFHELRLHYDSKILLKDLEKFFTSWRNRIPQKPLSFILTKAHYINVNDVIEVMEKYKKSGVIKKYEIANYFDEDF